MEKTVGRTRVQVDLDLLRQVLINYPNLAWRNLECKYYIQSGVSISFMTLWRRCKEAGMNNLKYT